MNICATLEGKIKVPSGQREPMLLPVPDAGKSASSLDKVNLVFLLFEAANDIKVMFRDLGRCMKPSQD